MAINWTDLVEPAFGLGGSLLGSKIQSGPAQAGVKENARQFDIRTQRADAARQALMPNLMQSLGQRSPLGMTTGSGYPQYSESGGGFPLSKTLLTAGAGVGLPLAMKLLKGGGQAMDAAKIGGAAMKGMGIGGGGLGATLGALASNPLTWLGAGGVGAILAAKKIGQGRKAANRLTNAQGAQGQFGNIMSEIARREGAGQYTPEQRSALLAQALDTKIQQGLGSIRNDKDRLVMRQWLGDFSRPEWMRDHPQLAAVAQRYLGSV